MATFTTGIKNIFIIKTNITHLKINFYSKMQILCKSIFFWNCLGLNWHIALFLGGSSLLSSSYFLKQLIGTRTMSNQVL